MKILRNSLLLLAASSIAFTSCNKKEEEILEELDDIKTEMNATTYSSSGVSAKFTLTGKNSTADASYASFDHSFAYNYIDTEDFTENLVYVSHYKGTEYDSDLDKDVSYDYYQKYFSIVIYQGNDTGLNDVEKMGSITINFSVYEGTLSNSDIELGVKTDTPQRISVSYEAIQELENNDVWVDFRDGSYSNKYNETLEKTQLSERFTISSYEYDATSGAISFSLSGKFDYTDIDSEDATVDFSGDFSSTILREAISPNEANSWD